MDVHSWIRCRNENMNIISRKLEEEFDQFIWSYLRPRISLQTASSQISICLEHNGDIQDENLLAICLFNVSKLFSECTIQMKTTEGDFLLFETLNFLSETSTENIIEDIVSIMKNGMLFYVPDNDVSMNSPTLYDDNSLKLFSPKIQSCFKAFIEKCEKDPIYQITSLVIPKGLRDLLIYDSNLISSLVEKAQFSNFLKTEKFEYEKCHVKFRRYHYVHLDSIKCKVPPEFEKICKTSNLRCMKFSFLMSSAYSLCLKDPSFQPHINAANEKAKTNIKANDYSDDDDEWLDSVDKPSFDIETIGLQMAERVGEFIKEDSEFSKIEAEGAINFNYDIFVNKIDHFLDSESEEDFLEEDEDELLNHIEDDEGKLIEILGSTKEDPTDFVKDSFNNSFNFQPNESGPTSDMINLFNLNDKKAMY